VNRYEFKFEFDLDEDKIKETLNSFANYLRCITIKFELENVKPTITLLEGQLTGGEG